MSVLDGGFRLQITGTLDVRDYTKLISFYAQHNWWHNACELLAQMPKTKVQPNVYTFSAAITTCEKAGQWKHAFEICQDMNQLHVVPNIITLNAVISSHGKGACWQPALSLFHHLPVQDPTVLGGPWHIDAARIWPGGNPGKYSCFLKDHPWPRTTNHFRLSWVNHNVSDLC